MPAQISALLSKLARMRGEKGRGEGEGRRGGEKGRGEGEGRRGGEKGRGEGEGKGRLRMHVHLKKLLLQFFSLNVAYRRNGMF